MVNISLSLSLADIESAKYGTTKDLKATLPLLSGGSYEVPKLCADRKRLLAISRELATTFRNHYPASTDSEAVRKAAQSLLLTAYQNPNLDWEKDPVFRVLANVNVTSIALDNVVDRFVEIHPGAKNLKMCLAFTDTIGKREIEFDKIFPTLKEEDTPSTMHNLAIMFNGFSRSVRELAECETADGERKSAEPIFSELRLISVATFCTLLEKAPGGSRLSQQAFNRHIGQHAHGLRYAVEANLLAGPGAELSSEVRNSLLYRMLMDSFGNATALINALCGLRKDVLEDTWEDTTILRDVVLNGLTLQESWEKAAKAFAGEVHDMNLAMDLLGDTFEDEDGVEEFLQIFYDSFMGTCFAYADEFAASRYVGTSAQVIRLEEESWIPLAPPKMEQQKLANVGKGAGMYFAMTSDGLASDMREVFISHDEKSLGLEGLCIGIRNEGKAPVQLNQQA